MTGSSTSLRRVLPLPEEASPNPSGEQWKELHKRLGNEVKGIKWAAMPDVVSKIGELLDIEIPDLLLTSWKRCGELETVLEESKKNPEAITYVGLSEHTINTAHRPYLEARIANTPVKKIEFILRLLFKLKGCILKVQGGAITEAQMGACELEGTLEYGNLALARKKLAPISLPGSISMSDRQSARQE